MRHVRQTFLILVMLALGLSGANAATSITIGKGDFYISVGDYDYLPYGNYDRLPRVSFYDMMSDYGTWVSVSPFGRAWRPYVYYDWQPFTHGHWTYTRFGPTWIGYEPWAWAAYHYGNWIWSQYYGWVWLPGYEWHPGRVIWSYSYNTVGWMPAPPNGYNYFCGYLCPERYTYGGGYGDPGYPYRSSESSYRFEDYSDFDEYSEYEDYDEYYNEYEDQSRYEDRYGYRDPWDYSDPFYSFGFRYEPTFFSPAYLRIAPRLWVFIPVNYFTYDNYADFYFDTDFVRYLFDRRIIQVNRRGLDRVALERIVRQRISEQPVAVKQLQTERQTVRVVVPLNEEAEIRKHANRVVKEVVAPAFVEKRKAFKGAKAKNRDMVTRVFKQTDQREPQVETLSDQTVLNEAKKSQEERKVKRQQNVRRGIETMEKADREGKLETIKRSREKVEKQEKAEKQPKAPRTSSGDVKKRTEPAEKPGASEVPSGEKFQRWKERETSKFNAWKDRQLKEFENWKKQNQDDPEQVRKAEADFKERMRKAEEQFQKRTEQAQQKGRTGRS